MHSINLNLSSGDKEGCFDSLIEEASQELKENCGCLNDDLFEFSLSSKEKNVEVKIKGIEKVRRYADFFFSPEKRVNNIFRNFHIKI